MKWNNGICPKTINYASKSKKTAHIVATFKINAYLCTVVQ